MHHISFETWWGTSFSLIFPVLIVITLAYNCTQILVQLCDKFIHIMQLKCLKLVISCVGSRNNSDSQESSDTNMSNDMNVYIVNFCSLGNAIKTILKSLGTLASRTTPTIRSPPTPTCRTTRTCTSCTSAASAMLTKYF